MYTPSSSSEVWHLYGARGEKIGQFSLTNAYSGTLTPVQTNVWFAGKLVHQSFGAWYTPGQTTQFDRLGSNVGYGAEYYPYGEQISSGYGGTPDVGFASYMHDAFTDLEYADQRYYVSGYGRFTSPDANRSSADVYEPGSLNRYAYVSGDPINRNDRSGGIDCWSYYLYLVNTGYSDPDTSQLGVCDGEEGSTSASLDPCSVTDTELSTFLGTDGGSSSCGLPVPIVPVSNPIQVQQPDPCHIEARFSEVVIHGVATGRNHTLLVGIDDATGLSLGVIDGIGRLTFRFYGFPPLPSGFFALQPINSVNGFFNNANTSTPFADTLSSASRCDTWSYLLLVAKKLSIERALRSVELE